MESSAQACFGNKVQVPALGCKDVHMTRVFNNVHVNFKADVAGSQPFTSEAANSLNGCLCVFFSRGWKETNECTLQFPAWTQTQSRPQCTPLTDGELRWNHDCKWVSHLWSQKFRQNTHMHAQTDTQTHTSWCGAAGLGRFSVVVSVCQLGAEALNILFITLHIIVSQDESDRKSFLISTQIFITQIESDQGELLL